MEKLLKLLNEYEKEIDLEEGIIALDVREEYEKEIDLEEGIIALDVREEFEGHLKFNGANMVQFPNETFDCYAISRAYGFIKWLVEENKINLDGEEFVEDEEKMFGERGMITYKSVKYTHLIMLLSIYSIQGLIRYLND